MATVTFQARASNPDPIHLPIISKVKYNHLSSVPIQNPGAFSFVSSLRLENGTRRKLDVVVYSSANPEPQLPSPDSRKVPIFETVVRIISSFWRDKVGLLLKVKEMAESTIGRAEHVADVVEEVAENVEKVAEGAATHLPKGKLHDFAEFVEKVAQEIDRDANLAEHALEKVEEMEKEVESVFQPTSPEESPETKAHGQKY
ncbi:hypothetical protein L6164_016044 [Bauhinia variegata]|uniref:Uncharacterized protein n=1 Tax=Bauhinia variegata TaxID=167791 RepID=A0ACB9NMQ5_BAUVA|nr:hypothetical protein L6164_016044 [Bauhinia variegata]